MKFKILQYFKWDHLPPHLAAVSRPFGELAHELARRAEAESWDPAEATVALRKLLEGKDAAVRALVSAPKEVGGGANGQ